MNHFLNFLLIFFFFYFFVFLGSSNSSLHEDITILVSWRGASTLSSILWPFSGPTLTDQPSSWAWDPRPGLSCRTYTCLPCRCFILVLYEVNGTGHHWMWSIGLEITFLTILAFPFSNNNLCLTEGTWLLKQKHINRAD